jgi:hypothetical protein
VGDGHDHTDAVGATVVITEAKAEMETDPALLALIAAAHVRMLAHLAAGDEAGALRTAMDAAAAVLPTPTDELRIALNRELFLEFPRRIVGYQAKDFEICDYQMYELIEGQFWLCGPPVPAADLASGNYFTVVGASQFYGRGVEENMAKILAERLGLPCLNLSTGGAGPGKTPLADPRAIGYINGGKFAIVQAMSGRSINVSGGSGGRKILNYLDKLYRKKPSRVPAKIAQFNAIYLDDYTRLAAAITVPAAMLFTSKRAPEDWSPAIGAATGQWGDFPHLVGADLYAEVAALFDASFEVLEGPPDRVSYSRFTGQPAPRFYRDRRHSSTGEDVKLKNDSSPAIYSSAAAHVQMADAVEAWCRSMLSASAAAVSPSA